MKDTVDAIHANLPRRPMNRERSCDVDEDTELEAALM